jgi:hypothetical protein
VDLLRDTVNQISIDNQSLEILKIVSISYSQVFPNWLFCLCSGDKYVLYREGQGLETDLQVPNRAIREGEPSYDGRLGSSGERFEAA